MFVTSQCRRADLSPVHWRLQSPNSAIVAVFSGCRRIRRQIVAVSGDYSRQCGQGFKAKIHYTNYTIAYPQQFCNKFLRSWRGQKSVVSGGVVSCRFLSSIRPTTPQQTCCQLVTDGTCQRRATSRQLPRLRESYGETCLMDLGHYRMMLHCTYGSSRASMTCRLDKEFGPLPPMVCHFCRQTLYCWTLRISCRDACTCNDLPSAITSSPSLLIFRPKQRLKCTYSVVLPRFYLLTVPPSVTVVLEIVVVVQGTLIDRLWFSN